ncbi:hypothetical protein SAMN03159341_103229 [Paenibacillus sp. 1_12]|uniref:hypothetical protein n=1 Tax=Paenibacillus sp. 1_12 TaxID=1566278 RepID=UPI0008EFD8B9|nr:hypothetical protein [Paenibacillus sp. 1_12]SFL10530.1 hypothetical protein SAMN03159341_103229 [Paenibacillus sp. 1_12]
MTTFVLRWLQVCALFAVLLYNWVANARPLNGLNASDLTAMFPVAMNPAPYALALWGAVYMFLAGFVIVQLLSGMYKQEEIRQIGPWFAISCLFNIASLVLWHYLFVVPSLVAMMLLLLSLIVIYTSTRPNGWSSDPLVLWLVQVPFSVYLSWVFVMTMVRISATLQEFNRGDFDFSGTVWTVLMLFIIVMVAVVTGMKFRDSAFILTAMWGVTAIGIANSYNDTIFYTAWSAAGVLLLLTIILLLGQSKLEHRKPFTKAL